MPLKVDLFSLAHWWDRQVSIRLDDENRVDTETDSTYRLQSSNEWNQPQSHSRSFLEAIQTNRDRIEMMRSSTRDRADDGVEMIHPALNHVRTVNWLDLTWAFDWHRIGDSNCSIPPSPSRFD